MEQLRSISHLIRRFAVDEDGVALLEFAFLLPIFLLFFAVTVEGGRMMWSYQTATAGVRDASRYLARSTPVNVCQPGATAFDGQSDYLLELVEESISDTKIFPDGVDIAAVTPDLICVDDATYRNSPVGIVRVTAEITIDFPLGTLFRLAGGGGTAGLTTTLSDEHRVFGS